MPCAFLLGGVLLASCDALGRVLLAPAEIPAGAITAFIGGPHLIWVIRPGRRAMTMFRARVVRADGRAINVVQRRAHLSYCFTGCCCGRTERGYAAVPADTFKDEWLTPQAAKRRPPDEGRLPGTLCPRERRQPRVRRPGGLVSFGQHAVARPADLRLHRDDDPRRSVRRAAVRAHRVRLQLLRLGRASEGGGLLTACLDGRIGPPHRPALARGYGSVGPETGPGGSSRRPGSRRRVDPASPDGRAAVAAPGWGPGNRARPRAPSAR